MKQLLKISQLLFLVLFLPFSVKAQEPTVQDCLGAIPLCNPVYSEYNAYQGSGNYPFEINNGPSCLGSGEKNDVWYSFKVQQTGTLSFSIVPNDISDDYDWAIYNLTNSICSDIFYNASLEVSCNYSGTPGITGANGQAGAQNEPVFEVVAGEHYVVNVGQFSNSINGYSIDFTESTAVLGCSPPITQGVVGKIFQDFNEDCVEDSNEYGLKGRRIELIPGNFITETDRDGWWAFENVPAGDYTITADVSGTWEPTCPSIQNLTVVDPNTVTEAEAFAFVSTDPCPEPSISISMPRIRPCFSDQEIFVYFNNQNSASGPLDNPYVEVELDPLLTVTSASVPYTDIGNNLFRFNLWSSILYPGNWESFKINTTLSCEAVLGETLCIKANLFPVDECIYEMDPTPTGGGVTPCELPWDFSSLNVKGWCIDENISFRVENTGSDMQCYNAVRVYIDGEYALLDSVLLQAGEIRVFSYSGDGRTWRLEADQHPLHPGNSHPNAVVELCGGSENWTPSLMDIQAQDDADLTVDIFCGTVTGSYDPNDKKGSPRGIGSENLISKNQKLDYVIRFQNTGTDTAFTVVVRDTLDTDLDIFSVRSGVSSHDYTFKMYGKRVLEWTFNNIQLPDSFVNEPESHGFVSFTVKQKENLPEETVIENYALIYFDFNDAIITNVATHKIEHFSSAPAWTEEKTIVYNDCENFIYNEFEYNKTGIYTQLVHGIVDTLVTLDVTVGDIYKDISVTSCGDYTAPDGTVYSAPGIYVAAVPNVNNCDSIFTIDLTSVNASSSETYLEVCDYYFPPYGGLYYMSGTYTRILEGSNNCDSIATLHLTVNEKSYSSITESVCQSYTAPDGQVYTETGEYTAEILNVHNCDSIISISLIVQSIDTELTANGPVITANQENATSYVWINCETSQPILGENEQTFIATENGDYAVTISDGECTVTSPCITITGVGIVENSFVNSLSLYPNPVNGEKVFLDFGKVYKQVNISISTLEGKEIYNEVIMNKERHDFGIDAPVGVYLVTIASGDEKAIVRLIKK